MTVLSERLAPLARQLKDSQATVRPVSQAELTIQLDDEDTFVQSRRIVLEWIAQRAGQELPKHAWTGEDFELEEVGAQRTAAVSLDHPRYWCARLDDSDRSVPQRSWVTEVALAQTRENQVLFGARLHCVTRGGDAPFDPSVPRFVRAIIEKFPDSTFSDGLKVGPDPWIVRSNQDVEELCRHIEDQNRRLDLIICAVPEGCEDPSDTSVNAVMLHRQLMGAAHVAVITSSASFALSDALGKEFSVFRGAVRTYRADFNNALDEPFRHPLAISSRISAWPSGGPRGYERMLINAALQRSSTNRDASRRLPAFTDVKRIAAKFRRETARKLDISDQELLRLADQEISALQEAAQKDRETFEGLVEQYERERDQALEEAQQANNTAHSLRARIRILDAQRAKSGDLIESTPIPDSLDSLEEWTQEHLSGSVEIHNRAFKGAKKSAYEDISLIYRSLLLLRDQYVPMRREGGVEKRTEFERCARELGLSEEPTFSGERWGEEGDTYKIRHAGVLQLLDRHLKKGNSRDERFCFRLYFFWDNDTQQVVVGWLPSHLDTRIT